VILDAVRGAISRHGLIAPGEQVLAAVSGGGDSVALLRLLHALRGAIPFTLSAAHVNHGLRGAAGDADARFVLELAASLTIPCVELRPSEEEASLLARARGSEESSRRIRHRLLAAAARRTGGTRIALGHTMDDQAETALMRLIRGAGRRGLSGMRFGGPGMLIRPLLGVRREALRAWLGEIGQACREDETNRQDRFLRNKVRAEVIPLLQELNPGIVAGLARTADLLRAEDLFLDDLAGREVTLRARGQASQPAGTAEVRFPAGWLSGLALPLGRRASRILMAAAGGDPRGAGTAAVRDLLDLAALGEEGAGRDLPGGIRARREAGEVVLISRGARILSAPFCVALPIPGRVALPGGRGTLETRVLEPGPTPEQIASEKDAGRLDARRVYLDAAALGGSACVRSRLPGDRFHPMGGAGHRKVSDYLIDRKVPKSYRIGVPLVVGASGIAWIVGYRAGEEYRIGPATVRAVVLDWSPGGAEVDRSGGNL